jgi:CHASE3 domain sensor protein
MQFPPPRTLPPQDVPQIEAAEQQARTITYGIAMVTGAIMIVLMLVLCGRALF